MYGFVVFFLTHMYGGVISMLMADRRRLTIWHGD